MKRAQLRNAVLEQKFYFRKFVTPLPGTVHHCSMPHCVLAGASLAACGMQTSARLALTRQRTLMPTRR